MKPATAFTVNPRPGALGYYTLRHEAEPLATFSDFEAASDVEKRCNAYQLLVTALRDAYSEAALRGSGQAQTRSNAEQCEAFGTILRDMGEL